MRFQSLSVGTEIKWPKLNSIYHKQVTQPSTKHEHVTVSAEAMTLIKSEGSRCNTDLGYVPDMGPYNNLIDESSSRKDLLTNMYWRTYRQAGVWALFCHLLQKDLVSLDCLTVPMNLFSPSEQACDIAAILRSFPFVRRICNESLKCDIPCQSSSWCTDIDWLATVISRHGAHVPDLLHEIEASGFFGKIDKTVYDDLKEKLLGSSLDITPIERDGEMPAESVHVHIFAVWLPHGISTDPPQRHHQLEAHIRRGNDIIRCYETTFGEHCQIETSIVLSDTSHDKSGVGDGGLSSVQVSGASGLDLSEIAGAQDDDEDEIDKRNCFNHDDDSDDDSLPPDLFDE